MQFFFAFFGNTPKTANSSWWYYLSCILTLARCCLSSIVIHDFCCFRCVTFCTLPLTCNVSFAKKSSVFACLHFKYSSENFLQLQFSAFIYFVTNTEQSNYTIIAIPDVLAACFPSWEYQFQCQQNCGSRQVLVWD